jgi:hypothetical protein
MNYTSQILKRLYNYLIFLLLLAGVLVILNSCAKNAPFEASSSGSVELRGSTKKETEHANPIKTNIRGKKNIEEIERSESPVFNKEKRRIRSSSRYSVAYSDKPVTF